MSNNGPSTSVDAAAHHARDSSWKSLLKVLLLVLGLIGIYYVVTEGIYLPFLPTTVRVADNGDKISENYFGFPLEPEDLTIRNIAVVKGPFSLDTGLGVSQEWVQSGKVSQGTRFVIGRSRNRIPSVAWGMLKIKIALGEHSSPNGREVFLGCSGHTHGSGGVCDEPVPQGEAVASAIFPGGLANGVDYIVYVEGDRAFEVDREMTVDEFAQKNNQGSYLVVTIRRMERDPLSALKNELRRWSAWLP